jgi:hypothetical protein
MDNNGIEKGEGTRIATLDPYSYRLNNPCPVCGKPHKSRPCWKHKRRWQERCGCGRCPLCICCAPGVKDGPGGGCGLHGGKSLVGPANAAYKNGDHSQFGPNAMLAKLPEEYRQHAEALRRAHFDVRNLYAVLEAEYGRLCDLYTQRSSCEAPPWQAAVKAFGKIKQALAKFDLPPRVAALLTAYEETLADGAAWERIKDKLHVQIGDCLDRITRMATAERDMQIKGKILVSVLDAAKWQQVIYNEAARVMKDESIPRSEMVKVFVCAVDEHIIAYRMTRARRVQPGPLVEGEAIGATEPPQAGEP